MKDKFIKKTLKFLHGIEWSNIKNGPREGSGFVLVSACPACGGIDPTDPAAGAYSVTGHSKKCELDKLQKELRKELDK